MTLKTRSGTQSALSKPSALVANELRGYPIMRPIFLLTFVILTIGSTAPCFADGANGTGNASPQPVVSKPTTKDLVDQLQRDPSKPTAVSPKDMVDKSKESAAGAMTPSSLNAGGNGSGGGNTIGSSPLSKGEIKDLINQSKDSAVYVLRRIELIGAFGRKSDLGAIASVYQKLFLGPKTVYQSLKEVRFNSIETGPCHDTQWDDKDASAKDSPEICFSLERLSAKLGHDSAQAEVLALVVHEMSHTMGATEDEAVLLQSMVKSSLSSDSLDKIPELVKRYRSDLSDAVANVDSFHAGLASYQAPEICVGIGFIGASINVVMLENWHSWVSSGGNGIIFSAPKEVSALTGAFLKSMNLMSLCAPDKMKQVTSAFGSKSEMPLSEFEAAAMTGFNSSNALPVPSITIRKLVPGDMNTLEKEIVDIQTMLKSVQDNF